MYVYEKGNKMPKSRIVKFIIRPTNKIDLRNYFDKNRSIFASVKMKFRNKVCYNISKYYTLFRNALMLLLNNYGNKAYYLAFLLIKKYNVHLLNIQ